MPDLTTKDFELPTNRAPDWKWRTAREGDVAPADMVTRHLFYTLRMIWNNTMPPEAHVGNNIRYYRFSPASHPESYVKEAIAYLGRELAERDDLAAWQQRELNSMAEYFKKHMAKLKRRRRSNEIENKLRDEAHI